VAAIFCVGLLVIHRGYVGRTGKLPGEVETFQPSEPQPQLPFPHNEEWHFGRAGNGTNTNLYVLGPLGPDGRIIPRVYYTRRGDAWVAKEAER